jgi:sigma-B regulation protein RsbU (phosphoserine phosphatase)
MLHCRYRSEARNRVESGRGSVRVWSSFVQASNGPLLAKAAIAAALVAVFLAMRRKEPEGTLGGYAIIAAILLLRDLLYAFFPLADAYRASDLLILSLLFHLRTAPFAKGAALWGPLALNAAAFGLLLAKAVFGFAPNLSPELLRQAAFVSLAVGTLIPVFERARLVSRNRELSNKSTLPMGVGTALYLIGGAALGIENSYFQGLVAPLFYCLFFLPAFLFTDIAQNQLEAAVEHYEDSIDSLFDLLQATGSAFKAEFSMQEVLDSMLRSIVERSGADGGILLLVDEFEDTVSVRSSLGLYPPPFKLPENLPRDRERIEAFVRHARFKLGEGLLGEVAKSGAALFIQAPDSRLPDNGDEEWLRQGGHMATPLSVGDRTIGVVSVAKGRGQSFAERDFDRCKLLASFGSIAVANSFTFLEAAERSDIEREAAIAENVQRTLTPKRLPDLGRISFGAFTGPARGVCSDYYDVIQTRPDRAIVVVGDVAGKGVAASLVMVMIRSILHLITSSTKDAATLVQWVNRGVSGKVDLDHYATLGLVAVDSSDGSLEFANAGHQPIILYRAASDAIETVDIKSVPIGVEKTTPYSSKRLSLGPGDILVMYTDGIVETMNPHGKQYGRKNLGNAVQRGRSLSAKELAETIRVDILDFAGQSRQHDDQTVLVMKANS